MSTIVELRARCQRGASNPFWLSRNVMAWPSVYVTRLALAVGMSANQVTVLSILSSIVGAFCFIVANPTVRLLGVVLTVLGYLLDLVDGEVARFSSGGGRLNPAGMFADYVGHVVHNPLLFLCWSLGVYVVTRNPLALWLTPILTMGAQPAPLLAKQVILVDLLRRGAIGSDTESFRHVAIDKPGEQGFSEALGGEIVERPGVRAVLSQTLGYPGPLLILPFVVVLADHIVRPRDVAWLLLGTQSVFAIAFLLNIPRTIRRNFQQLKSLGLVEKRMPGGAA